jgi:FAD-dependent oxidoreductase domain-containing protein 1
MSVSADVVIIGGGVVGFSTAFHLLEEGFKGRVLVIERDPSYQFASSALAMGGVRQQFMSDVNVRMVQYSLAIFEQMPECRFRQRGYLFLANESNSSKLQRRYDIQKSLGASCEMLSVDDVRRLVPELRCDDLIGGLLGAKDGYVDARATLGAFRNRAERAGAECVPDEVQKIDARSVYATRSGRIEADRIVIACGAYSASVARTMGMALPINPVRQQLFRCALPRPWTYEFPMTVDPGGLHWRSDGSLEIILAKTRPDEPPGVRFDCDIQRFYDDFMPDLVRRLPEFRNVKLVFGWGGLYEMTPDHNGIIDEVAEGIYVAAGFSGHGLMMSPATGKLMSELIRTGKFQTVEASALSFSRFERNQLFFDEAMI